MSPLESRRARGYAAALSVWETTRSVLRSQVIQSTADPSTGTQIAARISWTEAINLMAGLSPKNSATSETISLASTFVSGRHDKTRVVPSPLYSRLPCDHSGRGGDA